MTHHPASLTPQPLPPPHKACPVELSEALLQADPRKRTGPAHSDYIFSPTSTIG